MLRALLLPILVLAAARPFTPIPLKPSGSKADFPLLLDRLGSALLGKPYALGPLGEGPGAGHPNPLYRLDAFDCTTFIETVMANAYCQNQGGKTAACLEREMRQIRYAAGQISFSSRNHIPELDWLPNNEKGGRLENLSGKILAGEWKPARITIQRSLWLAGQVGQKPPGPTAIGARPGAGEGQLLYLPVGVFFEKRTLAPEALNAAEEKLKVAGAEAALAEDEEEKSRAKFKAELAYLKIIYQPLAAKLALIPSGSILNLVRAPAKTAAEARLQTVIAHQGLVVQRADGAHILHAAPSGRVKDQLLADYLLRYVRSGHFRGVSLYRILPARGP